MGLILNTLHGLGLGGHSECGPPALGGMQSPYERKMGEITGVREWLGLCVCPEGALDGALVWGSQTHPAMAKQFLGQYVQD